MSLSSEEAASMRKVKPAFKEPSEFEHLSGSTRYFLMFLFKFIRWTGLLPIKMVGSPELFEFKLLSKSSLFAFTRLLIFTFPFLILPLIFLFGGFTAKEYEENYGGEIPHENSQPRPSGAL